MPTNNHIITIRQINQVLLQDSYSYHSIMMWAICYTASFGSLHCSDFTVSSQQTCDLAAHLLIEDLDIDSTTTPSVIKLTIRQPFCKALLRENRSRLMPSPSHIVIPSVERTLTWSIVHIGRRKTSYMPSSYCISISNPQQR